MYLYLSGSNALEFVIAESRETGQESRESGDSKQFVVAQFIARPDGRVRLQTEDLTVGATLAVARFLILPVPISSGIYRALSVQVRKSYRCKEFGISQFRCYDCLVTIKCQQNLKSDKVHV